MLSPDVLDPISIKQTLEDLARRLKESGDESAAERLSMLGVAVEKRGTAAQRWAGADIYKIINPDAIAEKLRDQQAPGSLVELLEGARNVFIFIPIMITWFSISKATEAYNQLVQDILQHHPNQTIQPFLYLWQQGFEGRLPSSLTLSSIAWMDALILALILALTFVIHMLISTNRLRKEREAQLLYSELVHTIARASLYLQDRVQTATTTGSLQQVALDIEDMANKITSTMQQLGNDMLARFDATTQTIADKLNNVADAMATQLQTSEQYLQQIGATAGAANSLAQDIGASAQRLETANQEMCNSLQALLQPARELADQQQQLLGAVNQSIQQLQGNAQALQDNASTLGTISQQQSSWASDFTDALDSLDTATRRTEDLINNFGNFAAQQTTFLDQLGQERDAQKELANNMKQVTLGIQDALQPVRALSVDMRRLSVDTNDLLRLYAALPTTARTDMANIVNGHINAANAISKGGTDLSDAATAIFNTTLKLEGVINNLGKRSGQGDQA
ncbi:hypothetical protein EPA93_34420 [Ktedonosporobacter rubrisoli]|uniref:Methyl-accepting chemotaxis protein n=1 Tax=Ktedonosporobacter rubrisoli TaxID=2509675 RepID=A0A4V0YZT0_KTERU|nr:hypothetical protein [Ktedonosporobacter rubrisoli]QBD80791.1 hypothetical protein EPA93_34420 [Ktedonosporobacter rubrisoli]